MKLITFTISVDDFRNLTPTDANIDLLLESVRENIKSVVDRTADKINIVMSVDDD